MNRSIGTHALNALRYTAFDLWNAARTPSVWLMIGFFPMLLIGIGLLPVLMIDGMTSTPRETVVWVDLDPAPATLIASLSDLWAVRAVDGPSRPAEAELTVTVPWPPTPDALITVDDPPGLGHVPDAVRAATHAWYTQTLAEGLSGTTIPPIHTPDGGTLAVPWVPTHDADAPSALDLAALGQGTSVLHMIGLFSIVLSGTMLGLNLGPALATSAREGFNHILRLRMPSWAVFGSEMLTGACLQLGQYVAWVAVLGAAGVSLAVTLAVPVPEDIVHQAIALAPWLGLLAPLAIVQSASVSLLVARTIEVLPPETREHIPKVLTLPVVFVFLFFDDLFSMRTAMWGALLPFSGPMCVWSGLVEATGWALPMLGVQLAWTGAAVVVGGWVFGLDESPISWWQRRRQA